MPSPATGVPPLLPHEGYVAPDREAAAAAVLAPRQGAEVAPGSTAPGTDRTADSATTRPTWLPAGMAELGLMSTRQRAVLDSFRARVETNAPWSVIPGYVEHDRSHFFYQEDLDLMRSLAAVNKPPVLEPIYGKFGGLLTAVRGRILARIHHVLRYWSERQAQLNQSLVSAAARTAALERRVVELERELAALRAKDRS
jgi:hypothetical protein